MSTQAKATKKKGLKNPGQNSPTVKCEVKTSSHRQNSGKKATHQNQNPDQYQDKLFRKVWCALIKDTFFEYPLADILHFIMNEKDIGTCIATANAASNYILFGGERPSSPFMRIVDLGSLLDPEHRGKVLQVTRFGKRFTPTTLPKDMRSFWSTNTRVATYAPEQHGFIVYAMKTVIADLLQNYRVRSDEWSLSSGSDYEGNNTLVDKLLSVEQYDPMLLGLWLGTPISNLAAGVRVPVFENRITAVPKTYDKVRFIAMEHQWMSVKAAPIAQAIERCLPEWANIHDQTHNQDLALKGSLDNSLCTADLSAASDSLSLRLMQAILPNNVYEDILGVTSRRARVDSAHNKFAWPTTREYAMISTMGNRVTFPLETLVFSAAVIVTAELIGEAVTKEQCGVYGDDIICPNHWYPTLVDVLTSCGFIVNSEKSFADDGYFRESCGADCYKGRIISSSYWPRRAITREDGLPSLIALQHKFYNLPYTNQVITTAIRELCPPITESFPGSLYDDIWTYYPCIKEVHGSYADKVSEKILSCEIHTMLEPQRGATVWNEDLDRYRYYHFLKYGHKPHTDPILAAVGYPADEDTSNRVTHPKVRARNRKFLK